MKYLKQRIKELQDYNELQLLAGEMSVQEKRSVVAVLKYLERISTK